MNCVSENREYAIYLPNCPFAYSQRTDHPSNTALNFSAVPTEGGWPRQILAPVLALHRNDILYLQYDNHSPHRTHIYLYYPPTKVPGSVSASLETSAS